MSGYNFRVSYKRKPEHTVSLSHIQPKSILNRSAMGGYTLNPYAGCPVGCAYCYVPHMAHMQAEPRKWGTYVDVKDGSARLLDRQLARAETADDNLHVNRNRPLSAGRRALPHYKLVIDS